MNAKILSHLAAIIVCSVVLAACATTHPVAYQGLASSSQLSPNSQNATHVPFLYSADDVNWHDYNTVVLDPVTVYDGPDQQFGNASQADKALLAEYAHAQFTQVLATKYTTAAGPGPQTLRIRVTLTGFEPNTPGMATVIKVLPVGLVVNTVNTALDKQGTFSGSASCAVEIYDSESNRLLRAYVTKEYPAAEDIGASFRALDASKAGIRKGAQRLLKQLT
jgi:Protein of unknown function (DUF3313)